MSYITGVCRAYTDYIIQVENDEELINMGVVKGEDTYVDSSRIHKYIDKYSGNFISGGPTANSISMVSSLGGKSAFIGKVANDSAGKSFLNSFERKGIIYNKNTLDEINSGSGICILFVTPDGQRSIWFNKGVSDDVFESDISEFQDTLKNTSILFLGLLLRNPEKQAVIDKILKSGTYNKVATSLQSFDEMDESELAYSSEKIIQFSNIIFGNENEYRSFLKTLNKNNLKDLAKLYNQKIFAQTLGDKGCVIYHGNETYTVKAYSTEVKDTTGAGDAFAGGFLYALNKGYSMLKSAKIASYCGSLVANKIGARLPSNISLPENLKEVV